MTRSTEEQELVLVDRCEERLEHLEHPGMTAHGAHRDVRVLDIIGQQGECEVEVHRGERGRGTPPPPPTVQQRGQPWILLGGCSDHYELYWQ